MKYQNPILRGSHPDPSICKVQDSYYLVNSSFEFVPGLPVYRSKDLVNWSLISFGIDADASFNFPYNQIKNSQGIYAPTIRYHQGVFYVICTFVGQKCSTFIIESHDYAKSWSKPHWIKGINGIDPSLTLVNNKCYVQFTDSKHILQAEIDPHKGKLISKIKIISSGTGGRDPEGPHVYYCFGKYWLLTAEGGTREGHMVNMQVADNIYGPYKSVKNSPILTNRDYKGELQCVGHADLVKIHDNKFELVALAVREPKHVHLNLLGRETILLPAEWNENKIIVNRVGIATLDLENPLNEEQNLVNRFSINGFISPFSYPNFCFTKHTLTFLKSKTKRDFHNLIGIRQAEFNGQFSCKIAAKVAEKSGVIVYKDETHLFCCLYDPKQQNIVFYKQNSDLIVKKKIRLEKLSDKISFELSFDQKMYMIKVLSKDGYCEDTLLTRHLTCEESESPFTGVTIGVISLGKGKCDFMDLKLKYNY